MTGVASTPLPDELNMRVNELESVERGLNINIRNVAFTMNEEFADDYLDYLYLDTEIKTKKQKRQQVSNKDKDNLMELTDRVNDQLVGYCMEIETKHHKSHNELYFVDMFNKVTRVGELLYEVSRCSGNYQSLYSEIDRCLRDVYDTYPAMDDWVNRC